MEAFRHFDPFYQRLGQLLASDAAAADAFAACHSDEDRVVVLDGLLAAAGVRFEPQPDVHKDDQLAANFLDSALSIQKLRTDFE